MPLFAIFFVCEFGRFPAYRFFFNHRLTKQMEFERIFDVFFHSQNEICSVPASISTFIHNESKRTHQKKVQIDKLDYIRIKSVSLRKKVGIQIQLQQITASHAIDIEQRWRKTCVNTV